MSAGVFLLFLPFILFNLWALSVTIRFPVRRWRKDIGNYTEWMR